MNLGVNRIALFAKPRVLLVLVVILGILGASGSGGTLAYFTSTASSTGNTFVAGTIIAQLKDSNEDFASSVSASLTAGSGTWQPGQTVTAPITVKNAGTLPMDYGMGYTADDSGNQPDGVTAATPTQFLTLAIKTGAGTAAECTSGNWGDGAKWGTSVKAATALSTADDANFIAAASRAVAAGGSEVLCFQIAFTNGGAGVENAAMGGTSTLAFNFTGRQQ